MWLGAGAPNLHICVAWGSIHTWGFVCPALNRFVYHMNFPIPYDGVELTSNLWQKWIQTVWEAQVRFGSIVYSDDVWKYSVRICVWKHCISCKHKCGLPVTVQNPKSWGWSCLFCHCSVMSVYFSKFWKYFLFDKHFVSAMWLVFLRGKMKKKVLKQLLLVTRTQFHFVVLTRSCDLYAAGKGTR